MSGRPWPTGVVCGLLALLAVLPFVPFLNNPFAWDDADFLVANPLVHEPPALSRIFSPDYYQMWPEQPGWRPLGLASHLLDQRIWGDRPWGHRLPNLMAHAACTVLLYVLAVEALAAFPGARLASAIAAGGFALHPLHSENLFAAYFRLDSVATMWLLLALWGYRRWGGDRPFLQSWSAWGSAAAFLMGIGFKEQAIMLLPLLWIHDRLGLHPDGAVRPRWRRYVPFLVPLAGYAWLRSVVAPVQTLAHPDAAGTWAGEFVLNLLTSFKALWLYARLAAWPSPLSVDHPFVPVHAFDWAMLGGLAVLVLYGWLLRRAWRAHPVAALGLAWAGLTHLPSAHLIPGILIFFMAERYAYLPSAGVALAAAAWFARRPARTLASWAWVGALVGVLYVGMDLRRGMDWRDPSRLLNQMMELYPDSWRTHYHRGWDFQEQKRFPEARREYERAIAADPARSRVYINLAYVHLALGDLKNARICCEKARELEPQSPAVYLNLAEVERLAGHPDLAEAWRRQARALAPRD